MRTRKPLIQLILDHIAFKARCECSTQIFSELCDDLISAEELKDGEVRNFVIVALDQIAEDLTYSDQQVARDHLKKIKQELIVEFASDDDRARLLREQSLLEGGDAFPAT